MSKEKFPMVRWNGIPFILKKGKEFPILLDQYWNDCMDLQVPNRDPKGGIVFPAILEHNGGLIPIPDRKTLESLIQTFYQRKQSSNMVDKNGKIWIVHWTGPYHFTLSENYFLPRLTKKTFLSGFQKRKNLKISWIPPKNLKNKSFTQLFEDAFSILIQEVCP